MSKPLFKWFENEACSCLQLMSKRITKVLQSHVFVVDRYTDRQIDRVKMKALYVHILKRSIQESKRHQYNNPTQ